MRKSAWLDTVGSSAIAATLSQIATEFLVWKGREEILIPLENRIVLQRSSFDCPPTDGEAFLEEFARDHRDWTREDSEAAFRLIAKNCRTLASWVGVLVEMSGLTLHYDSDEPYVSVEDMVGWCGLTEWIDPDTILSFLLADHSTAASDLVLSSAPPVTRLSDRNLHTVLDKGVTDYHVHLGGMRSAQELWRSLLSNDQDPTRLRRYVSKNTALRSRDEKALRDAELRGIQDLGQRLARGRSALGRYWQASPRKYRSERERISFELQRERRAITAAWRELLKSESKPGPDQLKLESELGHYIFLKGAFLRWHRQPDDTNPGLSAFRRYYHSTEPNLPKPRSGGVRFERSPRIFMRGYSEFAAHIVQSKALKRIELRLPPMASPRDYHRFLSMWREVERQFGLAETGIQIGFAIHFKRSLENEQKLVRKSSRTRLQRFLSALDRDSATLHLYRTRQIKDGHAHRILRLDLAGAERDMPPAVATFCMNLARGDKRAIERLEQGNLDATTHRQWLWHLKNQTHRPPLAMPLLGQTCHAGEDYAHPLEGLYCVASAVERLQMREGDTIGHGLALAQDIASFNAIRGMRALTMRGHQFDSLLWLYHALHASELAGPSPAGLGNLSDWLLLELRQLYPKECQSVWNLQLLRGIDALRCGIELANVPSESKPGTLAERLVQSEIKDAACAARREERVPVAAIVFSLTPEIIKLQRLWLARLAKQGIVLEFNPSSNLRVSGSGAVRDAPFMKILEVMRERTLATINTDNPGVFATRIENEFALVFRALLDAGLGRTESLAMAERLRNVGLDLVYWPFRGPEKSEPAREKKIFR